MLILEYPWLLPTYQQVVNSYKNGKGHHAYLFLHHGEIGQQVLANELTKFFLCANNQDPKVVFGCGECASCQALKLNSNTDFYPLSNAVDDGSIISIDKVRQMIDKVQFAPVLSNNNLVLINNTHRLNKSSSNALLKTLEEPPERTIFLLFLSAGFRVLPTIRSRCMLLNVRSPTEVELDNFLTRRNLHQPMRGFYMELVGPQPDLILAMHQQNFYQTAERTLAGLAELLQTLELEPLVNQFDTKHPQVFGWQIELIVECLEHLMTQINYAQHVMGLQHFPMVGKELISRLSQLPIDFEKLAYLVQRITFTFQLLQNFPKQFSYEKSVQSIGYQIASHIALFMADTFAREEGQASQQLLNL